MEIYMQKTFVGIFENGINKSGNNIYTTVKNDFDGDNFIFEYDNDIDAYCFSNGTDEFIPSNIDMDFSFDALDMSTYCVIAPDKIVIDYYINSTNDKVFFRFLRKNSVNQYEPVYFCNCIIKLKIIQYK